MVVQFFRFILFILLGLLFALVSNAEVTKERTLSPLTTDQSGIDQNNQTFPGEIEPHWAFPLKQGGRLSQSQKSCLQNINIYRKAQPAVEVCTHSNENNVVIELHVASQYRFALFGKPSDQNEFFRNLHDQIRSCGVVIPNITGNDFANFMANPLKLDIPNAMDFHRYRMQHWYGETLSSDDAIALSEIVNAKPEINQNTGNCNQTTFLGM